MFDSSFPWIIISLAAVVDLVGLFYLWRRRHSAVAIGHRSSPISPRSPRRIRTPAAERRRRDRRGPGRAVSA